MSIAEWVSWAFGGVLCFKGGDVLDCYDVCADDRWYELG